MLTGLTELRLTNCPNVTTEGLRAIKTLASLSALNLSFSPSLATAGLRAVSSLSIEIKLMSQPVYSRVGTPIRMVSLDYGCRHGCGHRARAFHVIE